MRLPLSIDGFAGDSGVVAKKKRRFGEGERKSQNYEKSGSYDAEVVFARINTGTGRRLFLAMKPGSQAWQESR